MRATFAANLWLMPKWFEMAMLFICGLPALSQIDPAFRAQLTLYHEHQPHVNVGLENQDTGDVQGDSYFVLRGLLLPIECASKHAPRFDCNNPEENSTRNVISMHTVAVDNRFGDYAPCNVDPHTGNYTCSCGGLLHHEPCKAPVGRVDVAKREVGHPLPPFAPDWAYWRTNLAIKTGGFWYSTVSAGKCAGERDERCTWQLLTTQRRILAGCLETRVAEAVQKYDPRCFSKCPQPTNASSPCVAGCYMQTILGPHAAKRLINETEGMPRDLLMNAWKSAFASDDPAAGGCPDADGHELQRAWPMAWYSRIPSASD